MADLKVLMFGYNGATNTGAEALLLADMEDVRAVLGPDAVIEPLVGQVEPGGTLVVEVSEGAALPTSCGRGVRGNGTRPLAAALRKRLKRVG